MTDQMSVEKLAEMAWRKRLIKNCFRELKKRRDVYVKKMRLAKMFHATRMASKSM